MRLHWHLRKLQCCNLYTHVLACHATRATSQAVVRAPMEAQFLSSQSEEYFLHLPHKYRYQYEYIPQTGYLLPGSILSSKAAAADAFEHLNERFPSTNPDFTTLHLQTNSLCVLKRRDLGQGLRRQKNLHIARRVPLFLREQQCQVGTSTLKHRWGCWGRGKKER